MVDITDSTNSSSSTVAMQEQRIELRALDRLFTMSDAASFKIVHTMRVRGSVREFVRHAPAALMQTFNKHPRMRAKQSRTEHAATICPLITLDDVAALGLLHVRDVEPAQMQDDAQWHRYAQEQTDIPFDRFRGFPFCLHVWVDAASDVARLFLLSDHYISDGASSNTILNDVLTFASALSLSAVEPARAAQAPVTLSVPPPFYDLLMAPYPVQSRLSRLIMKLGAKFIILNTPKIKPMIMPRADQCAFSAPPPINSSTLLFASGTPANLERLVASCKRERTTFFGAAMAAIITAYAAMVRDDRSKDDATMKLFATFNLRERFVKPIEAESVGLYIEGYEMPQLNTERVQALRAARFWDLARRAKQETHDILGNYLGLALPTALYDQYFHSRVDPAFFADIPIPYAISGDMNLSSLGRYPHTTTHAFRGANGMDTTMHIESLHFATSTPFIMPCTQFTLTSIESIGYGVTHHYEPDAGSALFAAVVSVLESAGGFDAERTVNEAIECAVTSAELAVKMPVSESRSSNSTAAIPA